MTDMANVFSIETRQMESGSNDQQAASNTTGSIANTNPTNPTTPTKLFFGALPYEPDVKRIEEAFPIKNLYEGQIIKHPEIAKVLGVVHGTNRYYGVVNSWKTLLKHHKIELLTKPKIGYEVGEPHEIMAQAEKDLRSGLKKTGKGIKRFRRVDATRLDESGRERHMQLNLVANHIESHNKWARKSLPIEAPAVVSLPKRMMAE
jgi:hypothetical protein